MLINLTNITTIFSHIRCQLCLMRNILLCEQQTRRKNTTMAYMTKPHHNMANFKCSHSSNCVPQETSIRDVRLAAAYVPYQKFCTMFSPIESLNERNYFP